MISARTYRLAAVVYGAGEGALVDALLSETATQLRYGGVTLAGAVQRNPERPGSCRCDMILLDLASGREIPISEDRGSNARGCRLDASALEQLVGLTINAIERGADVAIINRFGRREAEGHGFRAALVRAMECGIPTITAVGIANLKAWRQFTGEYGAELALDNDAIRAWCSQFAPAMAGEQVPLAGGHTAPSQRGGTL